MINKDINETYYNETNKSFNITNNLNVIDGKYTINHNRPIKELSTQFGTAYELASNKNTDNVKDKFVFIYEPNITQRHHVISILLDVTMPSLITPLCCEIIPFIEPNNYRLAVLLNKPTGSSLKDFIKNNGTMSEQQIIEYILPTMLKVFTLYEENNICHGSINPDNIFISDSGQITIGDSIRELCGFSQPVIYESIERMQVMPIGKGEGDIYADYYALGAVITFLCKGGLVSDNISDEEVILSRIEHTSYEYIARDLNVSQNFRNLLKGLLCDRKADRWGIHRITEWLKGKKFNFAVLNLYKKTTRAFTINDKNIYNLGHITIELSKEWNIAKKTIKDPKIIKWVESGIGNSEMSDRLNYTIKMGAGHGSFLVASDDEILGRCLIIMNPEGGIRYKSISTHIEGLSQFVSYAMWKNNTEYLNNIHQIIDSSLINILIDATSGLNKSYVSFIIANLEKCKLFIRKFDLCFSMERILYELNPSLICQSQYVLNYYCHDLPRLLYAINEIAKSHDIQVIDRHMAAFIGAKLNIKQDIRIPGLSQYPEIESNRILRSLTILTMAQKSAKVYELKNLSNKFADTLKTIINFLKSKTIKEEIVAKLDKVADNGNLEELANIIYDPVMINKDIKGFKEAQRRFAELEIYIQNARNSNKTFDLGYSYGLKISMLTSYIICTIVIMILFSRLIFE